MTIASYDEVLQLARQLDAEEQQALVATLQEDVAQTVLSFEEWDTLFASLIIQRPLIEDFSPSRSDWYDDDGR